MSMNPMLKMQLATQLGQLIIRATDADCMVGGDLAHTPYLNVDISQQIADGLLPKDSIKDGEAERFTVYLIGYVLVRFNCAHVWLRKHFGKRDGDEIGQIIYSLLQSFPFESHHEMLVALTTAVASTEMDTSDFMGSSTTIMSHVRSILEGYSGFHPNPELDEYFESRLHWYLGCLSILESSLGIKSSGAGCLGSVCLIGLIGAGLCFF